MAEVYLNLAVGFDYIGHPKSMCRDFLGARR